MNEPATWMVGMTSIDDKDFVSLSVGTVSYIYVTPTTARRIARQLLLCADDVEQNNKSGDEKEEQ